MHSLLLNFDDVARLIVLSPATIENWAYRRKPAPLGFPSPVKVGRILRYRRTDIESWIAGLGTAQVGAPDPELELPHSSPAAKRPRGRPRLSTGVNR